MPTPTDIPTQFGRYHIVTKLGQGGMGTVYLAHDRQLDRQVALKVPRFADHDSQAVQRFYREARAAAAFRHPNLCPVHDVGEINGIHYMTMAYIEGRPLSAFLAGGKKLAARTVALLVRKIALAVEEAHRRGIVHRDLKPANVMIDQHNEPVVMDFGLARRDSDSRLTGAGAVLGTPAYMSPEQVSGPSEGVGPQSDVYSLGVILYELLAGQLPFQGPPMAVLAQVLNAQPPSPLSLRRDLDPQLDAICRKAMARSPSERYASMAELAAVLGAYLGQQTRTAPLPVATIVAGPDAAVPPTIPPDTMPVSRQQTMPMAPAPRRWTWPWIAATLVVVGVGGYLGVKALSGTSGGPVGPGDPGDGKHGNGAGGPGGSGEASKVPPEKPLDPGLIHVLDGHTGSVTGLAYLPDGRRAVSGGGGDWELSVWDVENARRGPVTVASSGIQCLAATPDGRQVLAGLGSTVNVWDLEPFKHVGHFEGHKGAVMAVAVTPDGRRVLTAAQDNTVRLWERESRSEVCSFSHTAPVLAVAVSPDGRLAVSGSEDHTVRLWDLENKKPLTRPFEGHSERISAVAFTPDGRHVVSAGGWGGAEMRVWDLSGKEVAKQTQAGGNPWTCLAVSPDGRRCLTGNYNGTVQLWSLPDLKPRMIWEKAHKNYIGAVVISPGGRRALTASHDHTIRFWSLPE